jgi:hypothetical protein
LRTSLNANRNGNDGDLQRVTQQSPPENPGKYSKQTLIGRSFQTLESATQPASPLYQIRILRRRRLDESSARLNAAHFVSQKSGNGRWGILHEMTGMSFEKAVTVTVV